MTRKKSRLVHPEYGKIGGTILSRPAGRGQKKRYYYIQYYEPKNLSKKGQCYVGDYTNLAHIGLDEPRYEAEYKPLIQRHRSRLNETVTPDRLTQDYLEMTRRLFQLLVDIGWSQDMRYVEDKIAADLTELSVLESERQWIADGYNFDHYTIHKLFFAKTDWQFKKTLKAALRRAHASAAD
jgi:hypothetical protein